MKTRISLHRFESDQTLPQRDGVNIAHTEINELLTSPQVRHLDIGFHDFDRLLRDRQYAQDILKDIDCVLSNVGPQAHFYFMLREQLGLKFRIIRDIKTALWSCYLLQETLCAPFLRKGDVLLATSNYSRQLTRHLFPHLKDHPIALFEPVMALERFRPAPPKTVRGPVITLGHIGRLSEDKNFPQMVDLLILLNRGEPGRYRLVACGSLHSPRCDPQAVARRIQMETGRSDLFVYHPPVPHRQVLTLLQSFDYFLFFSTSNLEVLGRVLIESAYAGTPILAANHAAAPELLDPTSLLPVAYDQGSEFYAHFDRPLGTVDIEAAAMRIRSGQFIGPVPLPQINRPEVLWDLLVEAPSLTEDRKDPKLGGGPAGFIQNLRWKSLPQSISEEAAFALMTELHDWFCALNGKRSADFESRLLRLLDLSFFRERTERFIRASATTQCDFTNLGGLDMELCNVVQFHPRFWLSSSES